jgi:hypothetical protein
MTPCRPTISQVPLELDNLQLDVVVFPFATMLASLLNCLMLNKLENLIVNPTVPLMDVLMKLTRVNGTRICMIK